MRSLAKLQSILHKLSIFAARARSDSKGSVFVMFALLLPFLLIAVGCGVDMARAYRVASIAQNALDSAALAAGRASQLNKATPLSAASSAATAFYNAAAPTNVAGSTVTFAANPTSTSFTLRADVWVQTPFLSILSRLSSKAADVGAPDKCTANFFNCVHIVRSATSALCPSAACGGSNGGTNLEVAMILDLSGSMQGQKLSDLQASAGDLVDIIVSADQSQYYSKVAIVPYSMGVNVGNYATLARGNPSNGTSTTPGSQNFRFLNPYGDRLTYGVSTCVSERTGQHAYDDEPPNSAPVGWNYPSSSNGCLASTITPLTSDIQALKAQIKAMQAGGSTAGQIGWAWGWYLLSPNWGYLFPASSRAGSYGDLTALNSNGAPKLKKIAVLMTDGEYNSAYCNGVISQDSLSGSGATSDHINCSATNGDAYTQSKSLCAALKAKGVEVYTVGFLVVDSANARDLLSTCATDASHYYVATDGAALQAAFRDIALKVATLRLTN